MSGGKYDIVCVGSALLDIYLKSEKFVRLPSGEFADGVALCSDWGGKTEIEEVAVTTGGGGTNVAVGMARKGFKAGLIAEMGMDLVAAAIKDELDREGVSLEFVVQEPDETTGLSSIMVGADGGRSANIFRGASGMLTKEDVRWDELRPGWIYVSSLGGEMALLEGLIGHAKAYGIKVALNPGMKEIVGIKNYESGIMNIDTLEQVDVLILNREEAGVLSGLDYGSDKVWQNGDRWVGSGLVVATDGRNGGKVYERDRSWFYEIEPVEVVEETGAGDAFGGGLVAGLMRGMSVVEAVELGKRQAASVVQFMGPKEGLLRF